MDPPEGQNRRIQTIRIRTISGRMYRRVRGNTSLIPVGSRRVIIDLTRDDSEDEEETRQAIISRLNRQLMAAVQQERGSGGSNVRHVVEPRENVHSDTGVGYVPVEGCIKAQFDALTMQLEQPGQQGRRARRSILLASPEARKRWTENGNSDDYLILRIQARRRTATFEIDALRKNTSVVTEVKFCLPMVTHIIGGPPWMKQPGGLLTWLRNRETVGCRKPKTCPCGEPWKKPATKPIAKTPSAVVGLRMAAHYRTNPRVEVLRMQRTLARQLREAAVRIELAAAARERNKKMEEARKAEQLKQEKAAQEQEEAADGAMELEQASQAVQPNQEEQPVEDKRAKKF